MERLREIKNVLVSVTTLEAAVILKLREFDYGEMTIKKREGVPYQIVKGGTEILDERSGLNLEDAIAIPPGLDISNKSVSDILSKLNLTDDGDREGVSTGERRDKKQ